MHRAWIRMLVLTQTHLRSALTQMCIVAEAYALKEYKVLEANKNAHKCLLCFKNIGSGLSKNLIPT